MWDGSTRSLDMALDWTSGYSFLRPVSVYTYTTCTCTCQAWTHMQHFTITAILSMLVNCLADSSDGYTGPDNIVQAV